MPTLIGTSPAAAAFPFLSHTTTASSRPNLPPPSTVSFTLQFKSGLGREVAVRCLSPGPTEEGGESENETPSMMIASASSSSWNASTYRWCAGIGGLGLIETSYLSYLKLTNSEAFCPIGGGSCGDVLSSDYAAIFGIPLPLFGMLAYGTVAAFGGLQLTEQKLPFVSNGVSRYVLLGLTTTMAATSAYLLYILSTQFSGVLSCSYCLFSACLSFSLFFIILKGFGFEEMQKVVGVQLSVAVLVFLTLSTAYSSSQSLPPSASDMEMPFFTTAITTKSSPFAVSLARHLRSIGAKVYGAFWCSHCLEQKQMFGEEAAKLLNYVECFPGGYKKGIKIEKACAEVGIEGFPTWVINGEVLSGEKELQELAEISGFESIEPS